MSKKIKKLAIRKIYYYYAYYIIHTTCHHVGTYICERGS